MELDPAGDADDAGLAGFPGGEVAGLLGFPGTGPVRAVAGEAGQEDLGQERAGTVAGVGGVRDTVAGDLVPLGVLRAAINLGNPVLAQGPARRRPA